MDHPLRGDFDISNQILLSVRPEAQEFLRPRLVMRRLSQGQVLYEEGTPFTHAIFPHEGMVSIMAAMRDGRGVEKVSIGYEGFIGIALAMGGGEAIGQSCVVVPGYASWLSIQDLDEAIARFPCVRHALLRYAKSLIVQLLESVACNSLHSAEERISRWLLHAHDRVVGNSFHLTQAAISQALGLRRATVNMVCSKLMEDGAIAYARGNLTVLERDLVEQRSCECYGRIRKAFDRNSQPLDRFIDEMPLPFRSAAPESG
ncbi:Crp/Fnr family transcriptional regulator [uncultured Bosea sp.]|uniref:Crp/Fnr family transcriptional regulator n=1 Tax=uncultured Bosea sp. TaxID=211457 RepID=UPI0025EBFA6E|nr:Crp/Fnr family transcriptional regulator [uncultured Bosea sp.]